MPTDDLANQQTIAELVGTDCLVSPSQNNWVSVYCEFENYGDTTIATTLSEQLSLPVIDMWIYDSEAAGAVLITNGVETAAVEFRDQATVGYSQLDEFNAASGSEETPEDVSEMTGIPIDELLDVPVRIPMFEEQDGTLFIEGNATDWVESLGRSTPEKLRAVTALAQSTSHGDADAVLTAFLSEFGLTNERMILAHRWIDPTTDPTHTNFIPGTLTP